MAPPTGARWLLAGVALTALASGVPAWAHGLGERYDLPLPLAYYLAGAGLAVAASFAFLARFRSGKPARRRAPLAAGPIPPGLVLAVRTLSVLMLLVVVTAGLVGHQDPFKNIAPVFVWVLWWVGFSFVAALVGNVWPVVSPFAALGEIAEALRRLLGRARPLAPYPRRRGVWPACAIFLTFAWVELVAPGRDAPRALALGTIGYTLLTAAGCVAFGSRRWLRTGEAFAVAFGLFGRFAPLAVVRGPRGWLWCLRPYAVGLLTRAPVSASVMAFTLLMLSTVAVDGIMETPLWVGLTEALQPSAASPLERAAAPRWPATLLLAAAPAIFALVYLATMALVARLTPGSRPLADLAGRFVLTLVPIAIAYHIAHYLSFLLIAGQLAIPLASDPLGAGWDLFGTTLYRIDIGVIGARSVWLVAVAAIVCGHVLATWLAHETALDMVADRSAARRSQLPILALMIAYTMLSLWILAQPIVEG